ncbi:unnamed protein product [Pleuronectes platessa]|uniref:Uncharacterized protein n=1 Tax=Pleuronectes platessa TaxID=8262 RepID=A0A9N7TUA2_PLEPL|nr:unnamed protein product [Pleuronectes platessa]
MFTQKLNASQSRSASVNSTVPAANEHIPGASAQVSLSTNQRCSLLGSFVCLCYEVGILSMRGGMGAKELKSKPHGGEEPEWGKTFIRGPGASGVEPRRISFWFAGALKRARCCCEGGERGGAKQTRGEQSCSPTVSPQPTLTQWQVVDLSSRPRGSWSGSFIEKLISAL